MLQNIFFFALIFFPYDGYMQVTESGPDYQFHEYIHDPIYEYRDDYDDSSYWNCSEEFVPPSDSDLSAMNLLEYSNYDDPPFDTKYFDDDPEDLWYCDSCVRIPYQSSEDVGGAPTNPELFASNGPHRPFGPGSSPFPEGPFGPGSPAVLPPGFKSPFGPGSSPFAPRISEVFGPGASSFVQVITEAPMNPEVPPSNGPHRPIGPGSSPFPEGPFGPGSPAVLPPGFKPSFGPGSSPFAPRISEFFGPGSSFVPGITEATPGAPEPTTARVFSETDMYIDRYCPIPGIMIVGGYECFCKDGQVIKCREEWRSNDSW